MRLRKACFSDDVRRFLLGGMGTTDPFAFSINGSIAFDCEHHKAFGVQTGDDFMYIFGALFDLSFNVLVFVM